MSYQVILSRIAQKDLSKLKIANFSLKAKGLVDLLAENPFKTPPPYEKLIGDLEGKYSRRVNIQHRLVYEVFEDLKIVRILRMWTHYE